MLLSLLQEERAKSARTQLQVPCVITQERNSRVGKQCFLKSMIVKKCHGVAFVEPAALLLAVKQQLDLSTHA